MGILWGVSLQEEVLLFSSRVQTSLLSVPGKKGKEEAPGSARHSPSDTPQEAALCSRLLWDIVSNAGQRAAPGVTDAVHMRTSAHEDASAQEP